MTSSNENPGTDMHFHLLVLATLTLVCAGSCNLNAPSEETLGSREWVFIPEGSFQMGDAQGDDDEKPVHDVYLGPYWITRTEITNDQYHACWKAGACQQPVDPPPNGSREPVVNVDWFQAVDFCAWIGGRLPTEAEWEKAARGSLIGARYPWGNAEVSCDRNIENSAQFGYCAGGLVPVGSFMENGYGLFDMAGNAWEWVADWYDRDYYQYTPRENPTGPDRGKYKVIRGGGWNYTVYGLRVAYRSVNFPESQSNLVGFRCVLDRAPN